MEQVQISWRRVLVFMLIATAVSNIARFDIFSLKTQLASLPAALSVLLLVLAEGIGVLLAAMIARHYLRKTRAVPVSFFGSSPQISLLMAAIALTLLCAFGVENNHGLNPHWYGLVAAFGTLLYCVMEEYGWRGYLQTELAPLALWLKNLLVGCCWYLWHLTFLTSASVGDNLFFLGMMVFGSWGIGQVADATKSILACACFHLTIQVMMFNALIKNGISFQEKMLILGLALVAYFYLVKVWERRLATTTPCTSTD